MTVTAEMSDSDWVLRDRVARVETVDELREAVLELLDIVLKMKNQCCEGGPHWGHAVNCKKAPD